MGALKRKRESETVAVVKYTAIPETITRIIPVLTSTAKGIYNLVWMKQTVQILRRKF